VVVVPAPAAGPCTTASPGADGIARCTWSLDAATEIQRVEATLVDDAGRPLDVPLHFAANLSRADDVRYAPGACPTLAGDLTVQQALDTLARLTDLEKLSGDGQVLQAGETPQEVVVRAVNDCGAVTGGQVTFTVESGGGTLPNGSNAQNVALAGDTAAIAWTLGAGPGTQVLRATLTQAEANGAVLPIVQPAPEVRFTATVIEGAGRDPGIHVRQVRLGGPILHNDATVPVSRLADQNNGLRVVCDAPIAPVIKGKPVVIVTLDLPYPLFPDDVKFWQGTPVVGFQPLELAGIVEVGPAEVLTWRAENATAAWLTKLLMPAVKARNVERLLVRVTVLGNFVWTEKGVYLDGEAFAKPTTAASIDWLPPSGDGRRGGNFAIWFWIR
jgi:hypothetical protein